VPNRAAGLDWDEVTELELRAAPARPHRGTGLSTQAIVDAAIVVADADGLDAVSIRRVAALLGVRPMSLYTHIASKDELLDLMANELVALMLLDGPQPDDWREAVSEIARCSHATYVAHPWVLAAFARRPRQGPNAARYAKQMARAVASLELEAEDVWAMLGVVTDYVLGHALRVATSGTAGDLEASLSPHDRTEVPELEALPDIDRARATGDRFELGLQAVLDGIEQRFVRRPHAE
jgi:AcrR family transcriptional regulator